MERAWLSAALHAHGPPLEVRTAAIVDAVLLRGGSIGTAREVAQRLGFRNRFQLARVLADEGLPPLHLLGAWGCVIAWLDSAERTGASLSQIAFRSGMDPGDCYRIVKRTTGFYWHDVRARGFDWCAKRFFTCLGLSRESIKKAVRGFGSTAKVLMSFIALGACS